MQNSEFKKIAAGGVGEIYTDGKIVRKKCKFITAELMAIIIRIPNILPIRSTHYYNTHVEYEYVYHSRSLLESKTIVPQDIADLIGALLNLRTLNLVHLDIKPSNLLFDHDNKIQLADLAGLHHLSSSGYVKGGIGTYYTVSPENILTGKFYPNSQVWSIGMTLYHILLTNTAATKGFIDALEPSNIKYKPPTIEIFESFVATVKTDTKLNITKLKGAKLEDVTDFIIKCLNIDHRTRLTLEDLLSQPLLRDCVKPKIGQATDFILSFGFTSPLNNPTGITTQLAKMYRKNKIDYKMYCMTIHFALTTPLTLYESLLAAHTYCTYNSIRIDTDLYQKLTYITILPANSMYYCMESQEHIDKFIINLETMPAGVYQTLTPIKNYYVPKYIDLEKFIKIK
jgi:serine/threonine protein kinase